MAATVAAGSKLGRYEIIKHLTSGGMADLLLARAGGLEGFERHVVIKRIRAEQENDQGFVEMFLHEARLAGSLHHHNIVQVYDIGEENGKPYFAMEYVHGEDLRTVLRRLHDRKEQMPLQHLVTIMTAVATALHHAHEQKGPDRKPLGIVHRDVTPANILVGYDGNVKVVDFGIARAADRGAATQTGMLAGKAPYMAPEQCTGGTIDRRCDVFCVGTVLYELATVRRLFKGDNEFITMSSIVKGSIPKPSTLRKDLPPELDEIVLRALAREPAARYQNAEQLFNALENLAIKQGLRTSSTALATYMKQLFGERPEPWVGDYRAPAAGVDFDGRSPGVVKAPSETEAKAIPKDMRTQKSSPIVRAQETAATAPKPVLKSTTPGLAVSRTKAAVPTPAPARTKPKTVQIPIKRSAEEIDDAAETAVVTPAKGLAKSTLGGVGVTKATRVSVEETVDGDSSTEVEPLTHSGIDLQADTNVKGLPSWSKMAKADAATVAGRPLPKPEPATPAPAKPEPVKAESAAAGSGPVKGLAKPVAVTPAKGVAKGVAKPVAPAAVEGDVADDGDTVAQDASMADIDSEPATPLAMPPAPDPAAPAQRITDPTTIVKPLPPPVDPAKAALMQKLAEGTQPTRVPTSNKKKLLVMGLGGLAVLGAVLAYMIGTSGDDATQPTASTVPTPSVTTKANAPEPSADEAPRQPRTWANSEKPPGMETGSAAAAAVEVDAGVAEPAVEPAIEPDAAEAPATATTEPTDVEPEPIDIEPEPTTEPATPAPKTTAKATKTAKKPVKKKTAAKPVVKKKPKPKSAAKKSTAAANPGWDPNSLFPKK